MPHDLKIFINAFGLELEFQFFQDSCNARFNASKDFNFLIDSKLFSLVFLLLYYIWLWMEMLFNYFFHFNKLESKDENGKSLCTFWMGKKASQAWWHQPESTWKLMLFDSTKRNRKIRFYFKMDKSLTKFFAIYTWEWLLKYLLRPHKKPFKLLTKLSWPLCLLGTSWIFKPST